MQTTFVIFVVLFRDILLPAPAMQTHDEMPPVPQYAGGGDGGSSYGGTYGGTGSGGSVDSGAPPSYHDSGKVMVTVAGGGGGVL